MKNNYEGHGVRCWFMISVVIITIIITINILFEALPLLSMLS